TMPHETAARVVNAPSDGRERAVSNHIFLVASNEPSGKLDHIYLAASASRALPGVSVTLTAAAVDTNYLPMDDAVTLRADGGSLDDTTLTLPAETGAVTVTARSRGERAETVIEVVEPDSIVVSRGGSAVTALTVSPNSEVALSARGYLNHLALAGDSDCFTWTYEGDGAALSDAHTLRAGGEAATGTLTVSLGGTSVDIPVTVTALPNRLLDRFEAAFEPIVSEDGGTTLRHETSAARVHNGRGAARLDYTAVAPDDTETYAASVVPLHYALPSGYATWALWVYAEQNAAFELLFDNGASSGALDCGEADGGWVLLSGSVPSGVGAVTGVAGCGGSGTLWLDQLTLTNHEDHDDTPPAVSLALDEETNTLSGRAFDAVDGPTHTMLRLTCDGAALDFDYDRRTGALTASLPEPDGFAHRVTLAACDAMGNLARVSVETSATAAPDAAFPDTEGHWANAYVAYLKRAGVSKGNDDGLYHPEDKLTRQEFAVMLWRSMNSDADYSAVELPFADADAIGAWALDAVRAMYALGIVNGSGDNNGRFWFHPTDGISRQEAAAMVGRLLGKGWGTAELSFLDSDAIPAWAAEHIRTLVALGILTGYDDGCFHPAAPLTRGQIAAVLYRMN
ncbi:MAG: S-layer homology domain-containing protein, partial [Oscillospiraceae bacterium]|nr:S-layer homology domain-containing protein [Oscillospiraceae bacterium]